MKSFVYKNKFLFIGYLAFMVLALSVIPVRAEEAKTDKDAKTAAAAPPPAAEEEKPTGDFTLSVFSQYIWRGYELSRNSIVVQPSVTIGYKGFIANVWGNMDTRPYYSGTEAAKSYSSAWTETDITLSYTKTFGLVNVGGGYIYYGLNSLNKDAPDRADAQEIFVTVGLNTILSPTLTVYKEIDHYHNWYFLLGISHAFEFNKVVSLKLAASASYLLGDYADASLFNAGAGYGGYPKFDSSAQATNDNFHNFHDGTLSASLPLKVLPYITVTPTVSYIFPLSKDARYEMMGQGMQGTAAPGDRASSFVVGGMSVSYSF